MALCCLYGCVVLLGSWRCLSSRFPPGWFPWERNPLVLSLSLLFNFCLVFSFGNFRRLSLSETMFSFLIVYKSVYVCSGSIHVWENSWRVNGHIHKALCQDKSMVIPLCVTTEQTNCSSIWATNSMSSHFSQWAIRVLWIWHFFKVHTLYMLQFVQMFLLCTFPWACMLFVCFHLSCWLTEISPEHSPAS